MSCKANGEHGKTVCMQMLPEQPQFSGKPCKTMDEKNPMPPSAEQKRRRSA